MTARLEWTRGNLVDYFATVAESTLPRSVASLEADWLATAFGAEPRQTAVPTAAADPSFASAVMENAFGNVVSDAVSATARWHTGTTVTRVVGRGAVSLTGATVGTALAGPVGSVAGLIIGATLEAIGGTIFEAIFSGEDASASMRAAYDRGQVDGAHLVGAAFQKAEDALGKKADELKGSYTAAATAAFDDLLSLPPERQADARARLAAHIADLHVAATDIDPKDDRSLAERLLIYWQMTRAATPTTPGNHDTVNPVAWNESVSPTWRPLPPWQRWWQTPALRQRPDLFVFQSLREWQIMGVDPPAQLVASIYRELAMEPAQALDAATAAAISRDAFGRFDQRMFTWRAQDFSVAYRQRHLQAEEDSRAHVYGGTARTISEEQASVAAFFELDCTPHLVVHDDSCFVDHWTYVRRFPTRHGPAVSTIERRPGQAPPAMFWDRSYEPARTQADAERALEAITDSLAARGFGIREEPDAAANAWLLATFGRAAAYPRIQGVSDSADVDRPVRVLSTSISVPYFDPPALARPVMSQRTWARADPMWTPVQWPALDYLLVPVGATADRGGVTATFVPPYVLLRAGNLALVIEYFHYVGDR
ncbi:MAG: hypothetical protein R3B06_15595 [Kofleriaceae bacterium]